MLLLRRGGTKRDDADAGVREDGTREFKIILFPLLCFAKTRVIYKNARIFLVKF